MSLAVSENLNSATRTCRLVTLGCKVNQYETQLVKEALEQNGFREAAEDETADLCVVNTCTVTGEGDAKSRKLVRHLARANPGTRTIVMGCYATRDPQAVAVLREKLRIFEQAVAVLDLDAAPLAGLDFHSTMVRLSGSNALYQQISMHDSLFDRHVKMTTRAMAMKSEATREQRAEHHRELVQRFAGLIERIEQGRCDEAERFWREHIETATQWQLESAPGDTLLDLLD